jgi:hypothetical protein
MKKNMRKIIYNKKNRKNKINITKRKGYGKKMIYNERDMEIKKYNERKYRK